MLTSIAIFVYLVAIVGAVRYNVYMVGLAIVWSTLHYLIATVLNSMAHAQGEELDAALLDLRNRSSTYADVIVGAITTLLVIYPHVGFIYEVQRGILSQETYPREEFSCCCGPREEHAE